MTIRVRDQKLDEVHRAKTGHSIHEARWVLNPCYNPDAEVPLELPLLHRIIAETTATIVVFCGTVWFWYWLTH